MRTPQFTTLKALFAGVRSARTAQATPQPVRELSPQQLRHVVGGDTVTAPRGTW